MRCLKPILPALVAMLVGGGLPAPAQDVPDAESPPEAAAAAEAEGELDPDPVAATADLSTANDLVRSGAYAEAEGELAGLQEEFPEDTRIACMRGELLVALQKPKLAVPLLRSCIEADPERDRVHFQLASALQMTGDLNGALAAYARELELNDDPRVQVMARLNRSVLLQQKKSWGPAAEELNAALQLDPTRIEGYGDLATLYIDAGQLDQASDSLERGREAGFTSAAHYYSLGARYFKKKNYEEASRAFLQALEVDPTHAQSARSLAATYDEMGRPDDAVQQLRRYLELRPDDPDAKQISARVEAASGD